MDKKEFKKVDDVLNIIERPMYIARTIKETPRQVQMDLNIVVKIHELLCNYRCLLADAVDE